MLDGLAEICRTLLLLLVIFVAFLILAAFVAGRASVHP
jgi:hypothetical protein